MNFLFDLDRKLLLFINGHELPKDLHNMLVQLTTANSSKYFFSIAIPLAVVYLFFHFKWKGLPIVLLTGLLAAFTDQLNYRVIKFFTFRARPFSIDPDVILRVPYGPKSSSFPSNHATNTMALAVWLSYLFPRATVIFYGFAFVIGYSRVYAGVHYPTDVIAGWILGIVIAKLLILVADKRLKLHENTKRVA